MVSERCEVIYFGRVSEQPERFVMGIEQVLNRGEHGHAIRECVVGAHIDDGERIGLIEQIGFVAAQFGPS